MTYTKINFLWGKQQKQVFKKKLRKVRNSLVTLLRQLELLKKVILVYLSSNPNQLESSRLTPMPLLKCIFHIAKEKQQEKLSLLEFSLDIF